MRLITHVSPFLPVVGGEEAIRLVGNAGFDGIDWSFNREFGENSPWMQENWREYAQKLLDTAAEFGIPFCQAHAPFPSSKGEEPFDTRIVDELRRCIEACGALGIRELVIHPCQHLPCSSHRKEMFDTSVALYRLLLPLAEEMGVVLCTENLYQEDPRRRVAIDGMNARPEDFCAMIDEIASPYFGGCLDIGHCPLVSQSPARCIRTLGKERLKSLHIHDVDLVHDNHTLPFAGKIKWQEVTDALAEIGYEGDFTFELGGWFTAFPPQLWPDALRLTHQVGRYLIDRIRAASAKV